MGRDSEAFDIPEAYRVQGSGAREFRHAKNRDRKNKKLKSPLWARLSVVFGVILVLLSSIAYGGHLFLEQRYEKNINRADLLGTNRISGKKATFPLNFLIIGTDKRTPEDYDPKDPSSRVASVNGERADTIIFVHIPKDKKNAYVISIPRDTDVFIPPMGYYKGGKDKINAAYAFGGDRLGAPLLVATVNNLLGVSIDYPVIVNFKAVRELTEAVGGVDVVVDKRVKDPRSQVVFEQGPQHLDGKKAEAYVRQRYGLPRGDFDRQERQRQFLFALMNRITQTSMITDPRKLDKLLITATNNLTVDKSMPVQDLVFNLKGLRPSDATFMGLQMLPGRNIDGVSYEFADMVATKELGAAINSDTLPAYLAQHPPADVNHGS